MDASSASPVHLLDVGAMVVRRWRLLLGLPVVGAVLAVVISLFMPTRYAATIAFATESKSSARLPAALQGLGAQLGIQLGNDNATRSPRFFVEIVTSREVLEQILRTKFPLMTPPDSVTVLDLLDIHRATPEATMEASVAKLRDRLAVVLNAQTNIAQITVTMPDPKVAASVANRTVMLVDQFNRENLQSQARARRRFVEQRKAQAQEELQAAEDRLGQFLQRNTLWQQSSVLQLQHDQLDRQVQVVQEVYLTLAREYETSRIQEVDDQSVITVVDSAVIPAVRSSPRRGALAVLGLVIGLVVAFGGIVIGAYMESVGDSDGAMQRFSAEVRRARQEMAHLGRRQG